MAKLVRSGVPVTKAVNTALAGRDAALAGMAPKSESIIQAPPKPVVDNDKATIVPDFTLTPPSGDSGTRPAIPSTQVLATPSFAPVVRDDTVRSTAAVEDALPLADTSPAFGLDSLPQPAPRIPTTQPGRTTLALPVDADGTQLVPGTEPFHRAPTTAVQLPDPGAERRARTGTLVLPWDGEPTVAVEPATPVEPANPRPRVSPLRTGDSEGKGGEPVCPVVVQPVAVQPATAQPKIVPVVRADAPGPTSLDAPVVRPKTTAAVQTKPVATTASLDQTVVAPAPVHEGVPKTKKITITFTRLQQKTDLGEDCDLIFDQLGFTTITPSGLAGPSATFVIFDHTLKEARKVSFSVGQAISIIDKPNFIVKAKCVTLNGSQVTLELETTIYKKPLRIGTVLSFVGIGVGSLTAIGVPLTVAKVMGNPHLTDLIVTSGYSLSIISIATLLLSLRNKQPKAASKKQSVTKKAAAVPVKDVTVATAQATQPRFNLNLIKAKKLIPKAGLIKYWPDALSLALTGGLYYTLTHLESAKQLFARFNLQDFQTIISAGVSGLLAVVTISTIISRLRGSLAEAPTQQKVSPQLKTTSVPRGAGK